MVTVSDVAKAAGVAYSTASLALRGIGRVAPETRFRIIQIASELGYQANGAATVLASQRHAGKHNSKTYNLGYLTSSTAYAAITTEPTYQGIESACKETGYGLVIETVDERTDLDKLSRKLWNCGVAGIILNPTFGWNAFRWTQFDLSKFAVVKLGRVLPELPVTMLRTSAVDMTILGLNSIYDRGYRSVFCHFITTPSMVDDDIRLGALYSFQQRHLPKGARLDWEFTDNARHYFHNPRQLHQKLQSGRYDAVFAFPWSFMHTLQEAGISIPDDLSYAGYALPEPTATLIPPAGVSARRKELGKRAVNRLHQLILSGQRGIPQYFDQTLIEPEWKDGATLPRQK